MRKARILCLHGYAQNGQFFRIRTGSGRKACKAVAEFEFLDGTFPATAHFVGQRPDGEEERGNTLGWWNMENTSERATTSTRYVGVEETLAQVREHIHTHGPYDGILGFSQGASLAALLCLEPPRVPHFKFAVMVAGFVPNDPRYSAWCDPSSPIAIPSMHIYGATDERVPPAASMRLSSCFEAPQGHSWDGGHAVPSTAAFRKALRSFIADQGFGPQAAAGSGGSGSASGGGGGSGARAVVPTSKVAAAAEATAGGCSYVDRFYAWRVQRGPADRVGV